MQRFNNILLTIIDKAVSDGVLENAATLAQESSADLTVLALHAPFPKVLAGAQDDYRADFEKEISEKLAGLGFTGKTSFAFETEAPYFVTIIRHVLQHGHDLVIKDAEGDKQRGFKSLDMSLLRKCSCPVFLHRDNENAAQEILVAIDPLSEEKAGHNLSIKLLHMAAARAAQSGQKLTVIACWHFEDETFLRDSPFGKTDPGLVDSMVEKEKTEHKAALDALLKEADIGADFKLVHERGQPYDVIPGYIDAYDVGLVVMGTVARTGIPGFIIGNTAENILQNISCSLLAAKPDGFVSPVKAY